MSKFQPDLKFEFSFLEIYQVNQDNFMLLGNHFTFFTNYQIFNESYIEFRRFTEPSKMMTYFSYLFQDEYSQKVSLFLSNYKMVNEVSMVINRHSYSFFYSLKGYVANHIFFMVLCLSWVCWMIFFYIYNKKVKNPKNRELFYISDQDEERRLEKSMFKTIKDQNDIIEKHKKEIFF